jgi:hypothetical protein
LNVYKTLYAERVFVPFLFFLLFVFVVLAEKPLFGQELSIKPSLTDIISEELNRLSMTRAVRRMGSRNLIADLRQIIVRTWTVAKVDFNQAS